MRASACSSGPDVKALAKQSCADWGNFEGTIGKEAASANNSARPAASAAAGESRWTPLVTTWQADASCWRDQGHAIKTVITDYWKKCTYDQAHRAHEATRHTTGPVSDKATKVIDSQCAIANSRLRSGQKVMLNGPPAYTAATGILISGE